MPFLSLLSVPTAMTEWNFTHGVPGNTTELPS